MEALQLDEVKRTGTVNDVWSRIEYEDTDGTTKSGYIPTSSLDLPDTEQSDEENIDKEENAGTLHESFGKGVFADAIDAGGTVERRKRSSDRNTGCGIFRRKSAGSRRI